VLEVDAGGVLLHAEFKISIPTKNKAKDTLLIFFINSSPYIIYISYIKCCSPLNKGFFSISILCAHPLNYLPFSGRPYPLIAPNISPFVKYFCKNGYTNIIGKTVMMVIVFCTDTILICAIAFEESEFKFPAFI